MFNFEQNLNTILEEYPEIEYQLDRLGFLEYSDNLKTNLTTFEKQIINTLLEEHDFEKAFDVLNINKQQLIYTYIHHWLDIFINNHSLNYENAQILFIVKGRFYYISDILKNNYVVDEIRLKLEAPNHSILTIRVKLKEFDVYKTSIINYLYYLIDNLYEKIEDTLIQFDVDTEFENRWTKELGIKPTRFIKMLDEDEKHFSRAYIYNDNWGKK